jgi:ribose transport system ATP-binding protein
VKALKNVSIDIMQNEVVGLIGENGAGKSTLMKILSGVYQPDSGEIRLDGKPTRSSARAGASAGIGMVFQEQSLLTNLSVGENIYLGNEAQFTRFGIVDWKARSTPRPRASLPKVDIDVDPRTHTAELSFAEPADGRARQGADAGGEGVASSRHPARRADLGARALPRSRCCSPGCAR